MKGSELLRSIRNSRPLESITNQTGISNSEVLIYKEWVVKLFNDGYPENEAAALKLLASLKCPYSPKMLFFDKSGKLFGKPAIVTERLLGAQGRKWLKTHFLDPKTRDWYINKSIGFFSFLRRVGKNFPFSPIHQESFIKKGESFEENVTRGMRIFADPCIERGVFNPLQIQEFQGNLENSFQTLDKKFNLCLGDSLPKNSIITEDGIMVVDWEYAHYGHRYQDWANFLVETFHYNIDDIDTYRNLAQKLCGELEIEPSKLLPFISYRIVIETGALLYKNKLNDAVQFAELANKMVEIFD